MFIWDFLAAFVFAIVLVALLVGLLGWGRTGEAVAWGAVWFAFLLLLFGILAGGAWVEPAGPVYEGVYWAPMLIIGIFIALILVSAVPPTRGRPTVAGTGAAAAAVVFGAFFWILLILLGLAIIAAYL